MYIINKSKRAVETSTAWANDDLDNRELYYAALVCSFIKVDGDIIKRTYEWVVRKKGDEHFYYTVSPSFGFSNRNCEIIEEVEVKSFNIPFPLNDAIVAEDGKGGYEVVEKDWEPCMVVFNGIEISQL